MEEEHILRAGIECRLGVDSNWKFIFECFDFEISRHQKEDVQEAVWYAGWSSENKAGLETWK